MPPILTPGSNSGGGGSGAGTDIAVNDEGSTVVAVASALNFVGASVTVTDGGSGTAIVTITDATLTTEQVQDIVGALVADTAVIDATYDDAGNVLSFTIAAGTVTNAMLAGSIALSKLSITGTPDGTKFLRDDGAWTTLALGKSADSPADFIVANGAASAFDYEFEGATSSLPSGWSWINQGTSTYLEALGGGAMNTQIASGDNWRSIVQSLGSFPSTWTVTAKIIGSGAFGPLYTGGLVLRESSSGKLVTFSAYTSNNNVYVEKWTNNTTYSAAFNAGTVVLHRPSYLRIRKVSSSSYFFDVSADGVGWISLQTSTGVGFDVGAFMTPDQIGFGTNPTGSTTAVVTCHWFRAR